MDTNTNPLPDAPSEIELTGAEAGVALASTEAKEPEPDKAKPEPEQVVQADAKDIGGWVSKNIKAFQNDEMLMLAVQGSSKEIYSAAHNLVHHQGTHVAVLAANYFVLHDVEPARGQNSPPETNYKKARKFIRENIIAGARMGEEPLENLKMASVEAMLLVAVQAGKLLKMGRACIAYAPRNSRLGASVSMKPIRAYNTPRICMPYNVVRPYVSFKNNDTGKMTDMPNSQTFLTPLNETFIKAQFANIVEGKLLKRDGTLQRETPEQPKSAKDTTGAKVNVDNFREVAHAAGDSLKIAAKANVELSPDDMADMFDGLKAYIENPKLKPATMPTHLKEAIAGFGLAFQSLWDKLDDSEAMLDQDEEQQIGSA